MLTTFFGYWAHRTMHYFDVLWRAGHQLHHGVARVDISSAFIFHPFDIFVQGVACALLAAGLLHVTAYAAAWAGLWGFMVALYQHFTGVKKLAISAAIFNFKQGTQEVHIEKSSPK